MDMTDDSRITTDDVYDGGKQELLESAVKANGGLDSFVSIELRYCHLVAEASSRTQGDPDLHRHRTRGTRM